MTRTAEELLAAARAVIARYAPADARAAQERGALVVDLRSSDDRRRDGVIPGSLHVPRTVLEWRADPASEWRNPVLADHRREVVLVCSDGFASSLAAASLKELGFEKVGDLAGGFRAWRAAGLPVDSAPAEADGIPGMASA